MGDGVRADVVCTECRSVRPFRGTGYRVWLVALGAMLVVWLLSPSLLRPVGSLAIILGVVLGTVAAVGGAVVYRLRTADRCECGALKAVPVDTALGRKLLSKPCPFCAETIKLAAIKCPHCGERLDT